VLEYIPENYSILDFGGGNCELSKFLGSRNSVTTIDIYKGCDNSEIYDGYNLPYANNSFDIVFCMFSLHHIPHYKDILKEIQRVCKKRIIILEDNPTNSIQKIISGIHYLFFNQSPDNIKHMNAPETLCSMLDDSGSECKIKSLTSHSFLNPTNHYLLTKDFY
jgi:2-polyprenyl-3-methyl-5-hydroxy-6-metoxy-1,4-benzoquinol methylase